MSEILDHINIVCSPPPASFCRGGGGLNLLPIFQKGGFDRTSAFRGGLLGKSGVTFSKGGGGQFSNKK